jgi:hypothetical protein
MDEPAVQPSEPVSPSCDYDTETDEAKEDDAKESLSGEKSMMTSSGKLSYNWLCIYLILSMKRTVEFLFF